MCVVLKLCMRILLCIINTLCLLAGISLLLVGSLALHFFLTTAASKDVFGTVKSSILIAVGICSVFVSILGYCGLSKRNNSKLRSYACFLICLCVLEMATAIAALVIYHGENSKTKFKEDSVEIFITSYGKSELYTTYINGLQRKKECCGINGPPDYALIGILKFPGSCCGKPKEEDTCLVPYVGGCEEKLFEDFMESLNTMVGLTIVVCILQVFAAIFACVIAAMRDD